MTKDVSSLIELLDLNELIFISQYLIAYIGYIAGGWYKLR